MSTWMPQMESLIEWFRGNRDRMPQEPFKIGPGDLVVDARRFFESLERDIATGPDGPRAFGLEQRLIGLQRVVR